MKFLAPMFCIVYALGVVFFGKFFGITSEPPTPLEGNSVSKKTLDEVYTRHFKSIVTDGGGKFVGIQEVEQGDDLVLFNSLKTGSTLAVKTSVCTSEAVAVRLALHEDKAECTQARSKVSKTDLSSLSRNCA